MNNYTNWHTKWKAMTMNERIAFRKERSFVLAKEEAIKNFFNKARKVRNNEYKHAFNEAKLLWAETVLECKLNTFFDEAKAKEKIEKDAIKLMTDPYYVNGED